MWLSVLAVSVLFWCCCCCLLGVAVVLFLFLLYVFVILICLFAVGDILLFIADISEALLLISISFPVISFISFKFVVAPAIIVLSLPLREATDLSSAVFFLAANDNVALTRLFLNFLKAINSFRVGAFLMNSVTSFVLSIVSFLHFHSFTTNRAFASMILL